MSLAGPTIDFGYRFNPGASGTEAWFRRLWDELVTGTANVSREIVAVSPPPFVWVPLTAAAGVTGLVDYPAGDGTVDSAADATHITFPTGVSVDPVGLLVAITNNTPLGALGQVRKIKSTSLAASKYTGVVDAWTVTPTSSSTFTLLVDCRDAAAFLLKSEYQNNKASTDPVAVVEPGFYTWPLDANNNAIACDRVAGAPQQITNHNYTTAARQSGYYHGDWLAWALPAGIAGAKILMTTAPATGNIAFYGGAA
jgi:hypothetical protein